MTFDFVIGALNLLLRSIFLLCMVHALVRFGYRLNLAQRAGMGFAGGAALMTLPSVWAYHFERQSDTPFDGWATTILMSGCILFFIATTRRYRGHERANEAQRESSRRYLQERGKL